MKKYIKLNIIAIAVFFCKSGIAQNPAPSKNTNESILFVNAQIHQGNGNVIENGSMLIENGLIKRIGKELISNASNAKIVDLKGKRLYPGIISPNSTLGLNEIEAVRTTHDFNEIGEFNPNVRTLVAHNTDSEVIPTVRTNGVLIGQTTPEGGVISGRSSIFNYDGWNWEDAVIKKDDGIWMSWPSRKTVRFNPQTFQVENKKNDKYDETIKSLVDLFKEAKAYANNSDLVYDNLKLVSLKNIFQKDTKLYIRANEGKEIVDAVNFCLNMGVSAPVIVGASNLDYSLDILIKNKIPVLVSGTHRLPDSNDEDIWEPYKLPSKLVKAGLLVGLYYDASSAYWRTRNLPFVAGTTAGFGLNKEEALQLITLNNAKILGIDSILGSLEEGKKATFLISNGDILDMKESLIEQAFIDGKAIDLDNKQLRLYNKYKEKYNLK